VIRELVSSLAMDRRIVLLRGINLGPHRRVAMPELREVLERAGFSDARTHLQSGNVVLSSDLAPPDLAAQCRGVIAERFGFDVDVVVRTRDELAAVVALNPLGEVATDPKRYQVSFLSAEPADEVVRGLAEVAAESERFVAVGRELYAWHPEGVARSKLWARLAGSGLGVTATARNWTTVTKLLAMADDGR
jgi:uncharacterized protein (DUF1697 family)